MFAGKLEKVFVYTIFAAVLCIPITVWLVSVGNPIEYLAHALPPGQALYVSAKLTGLLALCTFWIQCMLGLARRAPVLGSIPPASPLLHRCLGSLTLLLAMAHVALFFAAASLRAGSPAWNLFWPNFTQGYFNAFVSVGLIAMWCLLLGVFAGWRASKGDRGWRRVHMIWFGAFALVFLHAYTIGSESRFGVMRYVLLFVGTSLVAVAISRLRARASNRTGRV